MATPPRQPRPQGDDRVAGGRPGTRWLTEAMVVAVASAGLALAFNGVRRDGLPLVATQPYQTLVPCPEPGGPVEAVAADDPLLGDPRSFLVDARDAHEHARWRLGGAVNVPYDWLDPVPDATLAELARAIAASRARAVVVYGDGGRPDSGEHLGREISGRGIHNVHFVVGGAAALEGVTR